MKNRERGTHEMDSISQQYALYCTRFSCPFRQQINFPNSKISSSFFSNIRPIDLQQSYTSISQQFSGITKTGANFQHCGK